jgi:hypothetical protein
MFFINFYHKVLFCITCVELPREIKYLHISGVILNDLIVKVVVNYIKEWGDVFC